MPAPTELLRRVPLFAEISDRDLARLAQTFKERKFSAGDTIAAEGKGGVGFFVIGEGSVAYSVGGEEKGQGGPGEYFGEIALIDDGALAGDDEVVRHRVESEQVEHRLCARNELGAERGERSAETAGGARTRELRVGRELGRRP